MAGRPKKARRRPGAVVVESVGHDAFNTLVRTLHLAQEHYRLARKNPRMTVYADSNQAQVGGLLVTLCQSAEVTDDDMVRMELTPRELATIAHHMGLMEGGGLRDVRRKADEYDADYYAALSVICAERAMSKGELAQARRDAQDVASRERLLPLYAAHVGERVTKKQMAEESGLDMTAFTRALRSLLDDGSLVMSGRVVESVLWEDPNAPEPEPEPEPQKAIEPVGGGIRGDD